MAGALGSRAPRIKAGREVYYSSAREEGKAVLADVSSGGALLEETQSQPKIGVFTSLIVFVPNSSKRQQVLGRVTRHTKDGFAIEFLRPNPGIYETLVDDAASVTSVAESDSADADARGRTRQRLSDKGLELILKAALEGRRGSLDPEDALDIIIDRVEEMLDEDAERVGRTVL